MDQRDDGGVPLPAGEPALKTIAMPADTNPNGDIFGGWLLSQMDLAGAVVAYDRAQGRVATVALDAMSFLAPVAVGDLVLCYASLVREGRTSLSIRVESFARRRGTERAVKVTQGTFTYVAIDEDAKPRVLPDAGAAPGPRG